MPPATGRKRSPHRGSPGLYADVSAAMARSTTAGGLLRCAATARGAPPPPPPPPPVPEPLEVPVLVLRVLVLMLPTTLGPPPSPPLSYSSAGVLGVLATHHTSTVLSLSTFISMLRALFHCPSMVMAISRTQAAKTCFRQAGACEEPSVVTWEGALNVALQGPRVRPPVAQWCRPARE